MVSERRRLKAFIGALLFIAFYLAAALVVFLALDVVFGVQAEWTLKNVVLMMLMLAVIKEK